MVRRRRPVQPPASLQEAVQSQPVASPAGGRETTAAPINLPIFDYVAISGTLQGYLEHQQKEKTKRDIQAGERFVAENSPLVADIEEDAAEIKDPGAQKEFLTKTFAKLIEQGIVPPNASPMWQIGYARYAGRDAGDRYRVGLRARLQNMTAARGPDGAILPAPDVEAAMAEEWEKVAGSPSVRNFYGGEEALARKAQADEEFRTAVYNRRSAADQDEYEKGLQREVGSQFEYIIGSNPVVTSETLEGISAYVTQEMYAHNVPNPRELVVQALETSIQKLVQTDPDAAVRAAHAAQELKIGDVRLGDDRSRVGMRVQELVNEANQRAREATVTELQREEGQRRLAIQQAEKDYLPLLLAAKADGKSVRAAAEELRKRYLADDASSGRFGGRGAFVVQALDDAAQAIDSSRQSDRLVLDQFQRLLAVGKLEEARLLVESGLSNGSLTGGDYQTAVTALGERESVSRLVEDNSLYRGYANRYDDLKPKGFAPDVQQKVDERVLDLRERMERDYVALVQKSGKEDRAWLGERWAADQGTIRQLELEFRGSRDEIEAGIRQKLTRYQDAGEDIAQAERQGTLTVNEAQQLREQNIQAGAGRDALLNSNALREAEAALQGRFAVDQGGVETQEGMSALEAARQELRDRYAGAVDDMLANPSIDPRSFRSRADAELRRVSRELGEQLFPSGQAKAGRAVKEGVSVETISERQRVIDQDVAPGGGGQAPGLAVQLSATISDPQAREHLTARHPFFATVAVPEVPGDFYRYAAGWMSGVDPVFGSPVGREDVEMRAMGALRSLEGEQLQPAAKSIATILGSSAPDVLREQFNLALPEDFQSDIRKEIELLENPFTETSPTEGRNREAQLAYLRSLLEPVSVDMKGVVYRPFSTQFFRSPGALDAFQDDPAWPDFLRRVGLDPDEDADVKAFIQYQLRAMEARP